MGVGVRDRVGGMGKKGRGSQDACKTLKGLHIRQGGKDTKEIGEQGGNQLTGGCLPPAENIDEWICAPPLV